MKILRLIVVFNIIFLLNLNIGLSACTYNGITYEDGQQRKIVNGCIEQFNNKQCPDNYQFTTCLGNTWVGMTGCYPGDSCQQQQSSQTTSQGISVNSALFLISVIIIVCCGLIAIIYFNYTRKPKRGKKKR
jgi:hypothetical protein